MSENTKKRKRVKKCCITGCTNDVNKSDETPYYHFPSQLTPWKQLRRQQWINAVIKHNKQEDWEPNKNTMICGIHFIGGQKSEHPQHRAFNPTIFPGQSSKSINTPVAGFERRMKQGHMKQKSIRRIKSKAMDDTIEVSNEPLIIAKESITASIASQKKFQKVNSQPTLIKVDDLQIDSKKDRFQDFQCQVNISNAKNIDLAHPEYIMCNLIVEKTLNCAETQINLKSSNSAIKEQKETLSTSKFFKTPWLKAVEFNGISSINYDSDLEEISGVNFVTFNQILKKLLVMERFSISNANRLLIFLMKLKHGLSTSVLSILFHLSPNIIDRIINETLDELTVSLKSYVYWPKDRETMTNVLPQSLKHVYTNFKAIIDFTEIHIEVPTNIQTRIEFFTKYGTSSSFKIFFAFAPNGFITYRSKCYGAEKCDTLILSDCQFFELISEKDVILAIQDFPNFKTVIKNKNVIVVSPPFINTSPEECSIYATILNSITQIKLFKILSYMPANLISKIDEVVQVCCALNNLRLPLKNV